MYADAVRDFQQMRAKLPEGHINDQQAHALAIYAMDQMARSLVAIAPELALVRNPLEIAESGWQHRGLVWLPSEMALNPALANELALPETWEVTSDSLAAWLAWQLEASHLLLVKSDDRVLETHTKFDLTTLQSMDIVDHGLSGLLAQAKFQTWIVHQSQHALFEQGFNTSQLAQYLLKN
jgi:5-(aminomethyl)-3-furanmethanol phosphate kinase